MELWFAVFHTWLPIAKSANDTIAMMEVTIDDYGRIVIPKAIRDRLGLESGSSLELDVDASGESGESITLCPRKREPTLQRKGDLLVHTGRLTDEEFDVVQQVRAQRQQRAERHADTSE